MTDTCRRGHPWAENTYINPTNGKRRCRACKELSPSRRPRPSGRRLPLAPLLAELEADGCRTRRAQAERLGVDPRQLYRWEDLGVPLFIADRLAVALDRHPILFWDDFYADPVAA